MRVAVLSDLHGNPFALDAVLADLEPRSVDEIVCLGDVAIGPFPNETVARLRELGCPAVMGNWDTWFLEGVTADLILGGHTHLQMLRRLPEALFANPGSVGLPFSEGPSGGSLRVSRWAEYVLATAEEEGQKLEFRRVYYGVDEMLEAARTSGMPHAEWWTSCWSLDHR